LISAYLMSIHKAQNRPKANNLVKYSGTNYGVVRKNRQALEPA
jgi:hypothetical protein